MDIQKLAALVDSSSVDNLIAIENMNPAEEEETLANMANGLRFLARVASNSPQDEFLEELKRVCEVDDEGQTLWKSENDPEAISIDLRKDWTRLFRGLSPTLGPKPPYEFAYRCNQDTGRALVELKRIYREHGVELSENVHERADHLSIILEFAASLLEKERTMPIPADNPTSLFVKAHADWIVDFCDEAMDYAQTDFYRWYLHRLHDSIECLCTEMQ